ncbi:MAG: hypothetical protein CMA63_06410 [Euryarchaeota archaeon]|nr:hypothetical protein [Euryarchaeota archaeon]|tara:strand:+ start:4310 stop:4810 length:501 start_codon:yes stop_codon:yes gene_type:complete
MSHQDLREYDNYYARHNRIQVVTAAQEHIAAIAENLRPMDAIEIACMGGDPAEALSRGIEESHCALTVLDDDDVPIAMFGVNACGNHMHSIWCLGTPGVEENLRDWIRYSRKYVNSISAPFGVTFNFVHHENEKAIRWLRFCGAQFINERKFNNQKFYEFIICVNL